MPTVSCLVFRPEWVGDEWLDKQKKKKHTLCWKWDLVKINLPTYIIVRCGLTGRLLFSRLDSSFDAFWSNPCWKANTQEDGWETVSITCLQALSIPHCLGICKATQPTWMLSIKECLSNVCATFMSRNTLLKEYDTEQLLQALMVAVSFHVLTRAGTNSRLNFSSL